MRCRLFSIAASDWQPRPSLLPSSQRKVRCEIRYALRKAEHVSYIYDTLHLFLLSHLSVSVINLFIHAAALIQVLPYSLTIPVFLPLLPLSAFPFIKMQLPHQDTLFLDPLYNNLHFIEFGWKQNKWWRLSSIFACSSLFPFSSKPVIVVLPFHSLYLSVYSTCHHVFILPHQPWSAFLNCSFLLLPPALCLSPSA